MSNVSRITPVVQMTLPRELLSAIDAWCARESQSRFGARITRSQAVRELCAQALGADWQKQASERVARIGPLSIAAYGGKHASMRKDRVRLIKPKQRPGQRRKKN